MNKSDQKRAEKKCKELLEKLAEVNQGTWVNWETLSNYKLQALKEETWDNGVRLVILNYLQKEIPDQSPYLPTEVIQFLKPVLRA